MAQKSRYRIRQLRILARRFGLGGSRAVVAVCAALVIVVGAFGAWRIVGQQGTVLERGHGTTTSEKGEVNASSSQDASHKSWDADSQHQEESDSALVLVHVDGAVKKPGVYNVGKGSPRVNDVIELAGGLLDNADTSSINLALPVEDGQKVHVPAQGETASEQSPSETPPANNSTGDAGTAPQPENSNNDLVNINTASSEELQTLAGIGEATATAILEDRQSNGSFASKEDLMRVSGIGEKKFEKIKDKICV